MRTIVATVLVLVIAAAIGKKSEACSIAAPPKYSSDPNEIQFDSSPPSKVTVVSYWVTRGNNDGPGGCADMCDGYGEVRLKIEPSTDDRTPQDKIGYEISLEGGGSEEIRYFFPSDPQLASYGDTLYFFWNDGAEKNQGSFEVTLNLRSIDLAGNKSEPTSYIIRDPGRCGCVSNGSNGGYGSMVVGIPVFLWMVFRQRKAATDPRSIEP